MNDSTPSAPTSEEGEPTSFVEKTKNWYGKHRTKIRAACGAVGGVAVVVAVVVARQAMKQNATEDTAESEDTGSAAESVEEDERRKPPVRHSVSGYTRRLADGREIPVSGYERGGSSEDEGQDEDEDEEPDEDAA
ncbi:hypothetical protein [Streptomyces sp. NRRL S-340]|uniref:hypothetical protein n=1 Tax=Streptomyces sp. NRRL S-340 TaxID=1463901 RepID=UPI0005662FC9|nr:hypothetical protein [Streptomyces sp. NRRL S-340]